MNHDQSGLILSGSATEHSVAVPNTWFCEGRVVADNQNGLFDPTNGTKSRSCGVGSSRRRESRQQDPNEKPDLRYRTLFRRLIKINHD